MRNKLGCFILIMIIVTSQIFAGSVYYVDSTSGYDTNPGTEALPWRTIQKAANTMVAGDSVIVNSGNYNERVSVFRSGSSDAPITYQANGSVINRGFSINGDHVHIIGFEITNTFDDYADGPGIYIDNNSDFCQIEACHIHDTTRAGVLLERISSNCIVRNNIIERVWLCGVNIFGDDHIIEGNDISHILSYPPGYANPPGWTDADGIHIKGTGHILRENYVHDILRNEGGNDLAHIDCFQITGSTSDIVWEQNLFHINDTDNNFQGAMIEAWDGPVSDLTFRNNIFISNCKLNIWGYGKHINHVIVVNNTFIGEKGYTVELHDCPNAKVMNNIFYDCGNHTRQYLWHDTDEGLEVGYNLHYMSDGNEPKRTSFLPRPTDLWQVNPRFVDAANYDLHLQPDSPCIDAGATLSDVTNDLDGSPRPQGAGYDIGA
ncbi:right-handed parallel beta-helix repeat-containing protein, partial [bacterium]|nr:right-handed parallel beta-helix repeat-containing protein [bacterium]